MNLPDFIGIGTPKAATTWLFQCLAEHPEICMSKTKEVNYFNDDRLYALGPSWYAQQFSHRTNERICGEFTPTYLSSPEVPKRIAESLPNAKIILVLRDPVDRFVSAVSFEASQGRNDGNLNIQVKTPKIQRNLDRGLYYSYLIHFLHYFPLERIFITIYKELRENPRRELKRLYSFLGVAPDFVPPSINARYNTTNQTNRYWLPGLKRSYDVILRSLANNPYRPNILAIARVTGLSKLGKFINRLNDRDSTDSDIVSTYTQPSDEEREMLIRYYREDSEKLERLLGRSLPWQSVE